MQPARPSSRVPIAIIGPGKIATTQHVPAIADSGSLVLRATVGDRGGYAGIPHYPTLTALLNEGPAVQAVSICTPPQVRGQIAHQALMAGLHVLLEKPPCGTLAECDALIGTAVARGVTLFAAWHSRFAAAVALATAWLAERTIVSGTVSWRENVRQWHPGQTWLWQPGGLGVFDSGINALSILTAICPAPLFVQDASFSRPANAHTPIAAAMTLRTGGAILATDLDFQQPGQPTWSIRLATSDGGTLLLDEGGAAMSIDGGPRQTGPDAEYPALYRRFAQLIADSASDCDIAPLRLVADAAMLASQHIVQAFEP